MSVLLVQPFGLESPGGGARILRTLCGDSPTSVISICASPSPPPPTQIAEEIHFPIRPHVPRLRSTRLNAGVRQLDNIAHRGLTQELTTIVRHRQIAAIHALADAQISFAIAHQVARNAGVRFVLSVHDAPWYKRLRLQAGNRRFYAALGRAWRDADARTVISPQMGEALSTRYGSRPFSVVTDGLETIAAAPATGVPQTFIIYFCGSMHLAHKDNFTALIEAVDWIRQHTAWRPRIVLRPGKIAGALQTGFVEERPWVNDDEVTAEAAAADVLYLPLPFGERYAAFTELSLPTKLVTYLGTGRPILYHGPSTAAAGQLLRVSGAGTVFDLRDPEQLATAIVQWIESDEPAANASKALELARTRFLRKTQRELFWDAMLGHRQTTLR